MVKTSCIRHPENHPYLKIYKWQIELCNDDYCAASILSVIEYLYNCKLVEVNGRKNLNQELIKKGIKDQISDSLLIHINREKLIKMILGLYKKTAVTGALKKLEELGFIKIYDFYEVCKDVDSKFDHMDESVSKKLNKTRFLMFYPEVVNEWIEQHYGTNCCEQNRLKTQQHNSTNNAQNTESPKTAFGAEKPKTAFDEQKTKIIKKQIVTPNGQKRPSIAENGRYIDNRYIDRKKVSLKLSVGNFGDDSFLNSLPKQIQSVIKLCYQNGLPLEKLTRVDDIKNIEAFLGKGANLNHFQYALDKAYACKGEEIFGLYYILKIVDQQLTAANRSNTAKSKQKQIRQQMKQEIKKQVEDELKQTEKSNKRLAAFELESISKNDGLQKFKQKYPEKNSAELAELARKQLRKYGFRNSQNSKGGFK